MKVVVRNVSMKCLCLTIHEQRVAKHVRVVGTHEWPQSLLGCVVACFIEYATKTAMLTSFPCRV